jgi:hypothetical protein
MPFLLHPVPSKKSLFVFFFEILYMHAKIEQMAAVKYLGRKKILLVQANFQSALSFPHIKTSSWCVFAVKGWHTQLVVQVVRTTGIE